MPNLNDLKALLSELAAAAQREYDAWEQDEDGIDEELGSGGICHLIADQFISVLAGAGIEAVTTHSEGVGENHVWVTACIEEGVVLVDIPPGVYETGGGYTWQKKPGIVFSKNDIVVDRIDPDPSKFHEYAGLVDEGGLNF